MIEPEHFQVILASIGIGSTVLLAWLFRYMWIPQPEKIFEKNLQSVSKIIFQHLSLIDSYKLTIFNFLERETSFDMTKRPFHIFSEFVFNELLRFQSLIREEAKLLTKISKFGGYITLNQYLAIQQYATSAYSFFHTISDMENAIGVNEKTLEWHKYYAAEVIRLFGKTAPKDFCDKWYLEFVREGGIDAITKPTIEPGDMIGPEYNLHNSLLFYDGLIEIKNKLNQIQRSLDNMSQEV